jgi:LmbE family N-acetylglucosaminyl deacetylase
VDAGPAGAGAALIRALCAPADARLALPATAVVVAHPDDEVVGAGSRLPRLAGARFVYLTDGAPRDGGDAAVHGLSVAQYAQARRRERDAALRLCGIAPAQALDLDCVDQEAALQLAPLARRLAGLFAQWGTQAVLTQPYEGGHPDHDASAFAVHAACGLLRARGATPPALVEMAGYHQQDGQLRTTRFLCAPRGEATVQLDAPEQALRQALLDCHATQGRTLAIFRGVAHESFRSAPGCDFTRPPHAGQLHYERHGWAIDGARFCRLATEALRELGLEGPL